MTVTEQTPLDVWLRFVEDDDEEAEAEANTYEDGEGGYRVEWYLNSVGLVKSVAFPSYEQAKAWLEAEGFQDFTT